MSLYKAMEPLAYSHARSTGLDVTGAGDTVVGTLALALSTGATMREAAVLANQAAGVVVGMVGNRHGHGVTTRLMRWTRAERPTVTVVFLRGYGSSRFPGKPFVDLLGKPMIQHVYEQAKACGAVDQVVVATDDERIKRLSKIRRDGYSDDGALPHRNRSRGGGGTPMPRRLLCRSRRETKLC